MRVQHHSHSYPLNQRNSGKEVVIAGKSPQLYHGHEELKRTVEADFPEVTADLEALLKTNVLSSAVEAGCFWRLLCTLPLLPLSHFTPPTFAARTNIPWAREAISSWSGGEDWNSWQENTCSVSAAKSDPFSLLLYLCGLGKVGCLFLTSCVTILRRFTSGIWNGSVTMDIREPCLFLLVLPVFERGVRLLVAFSVHCCIHTDTHVCMFVSKTGQTLRGYL